jgi:hypothetical protein
MASSTDASIRPNKRKGRAPRRIETRSVAEMEAAEAFRSLLAILPGPQLAPRTRLNPKTRMTPVVCSALASAIRESVESALLQGGFVRSGAEVGDRERRLRLVPGNGPGMTLTRRAFASPLRDPSDASALPQRIIDAALRATAGLRAAMETGLRDWEYRGADATPLFMGYKARAVVFDAVYHSLL